MRYLGKQAVIAESTLPTFTFLASLDLLIIIITKMRPQRSPGRGGMYVSSSSRLITLFKRLRTCAPAPPMYNGVSFEATAGKNSPTQINNALFAFQQQQGTASKDAQIRRPAAVSSTTSPKIVLQQ